MLFSKTHQKKTQTIPFFHTPPKTHINLNLKALVLKTSPNPKRRTFSRRQKSTDRSSKRRSSAEAWGPLCKCRPGPGIDEGRLEMCQLYPLVNEHSWLENQHFLIGDTSTSNGGFPIAMLVYRNVYVRVFLFIIIASSTKACLLFDGNQKSGISTSFLVGRKYPSIYSGFYTPETVVVGDVVPSSVDSMSTPVWGGSPQSWLTNLFAEFDPPCFRCPKIFYGASESHKAGCTGVTKMYVTWNILRYRTKICGKDHGKVCFIIL